MDYHFTDDEIYAIKGSNGSGKSTLMKMISGFLSPSKGKITYQSGGNDIERGNIYQSLSFAAPYISLLKSLTIEEMVTFAFKFKDRYNGISEKEFYSRMELPVNKKSLLTELSSGQLQRLNLAIAIMSESKLLLLDEPSSYLDVTSKKWMNELIFNHAKSRLIIIASNDKSDLVHCTKELNIEKFQ